MKHLARLAIAFLMVGSIGCDDGSSLPPTDPVPDSGHVAPDAAFEVDASLEDSGGMVPAEDAQVEETLDAASGDASEPLIDAMVIDGSPGDAAQPDDAGPDAAGPDAAAECPAGYEGDGITCQDIDECEAETDACNPYAWCTNTIGGYTCECFTGALGDGFDCTDVDQCLAETDDCDPNAVCTNVFGLYECDCLDGFIGDGFACGNIDECAEQTDACAADAQCTDAVGSYDCECNDGYEGDGFSCEAINECEQGSATCDSLTSCVDMGAGYECTACPAGYGGSGGTACIPQLVSLVPSSGRLEPSFAPTMLSYALTTGLDAPDFHVTPSAPAGVTILVDGMAVASGTAGPSVALPAIGVQAAMSIALSAPNGGTRAYSVGVERNYAERVYIKASNAGEFDGFGGALAVDGDVMVVGASAEDSAAIGVNGNQASEGATSSGAAYVFRRVAGAWQQEAYLKASNSQGSNNGSGALADGFGTSVAVSGDRIVIGSYAEDSAATGVNGNQLDNSIQNSGAAYVFRFNGAQWLQEAYLKASNTGSADFFGNAVAISGDVVVIGAPLEDSAIGGIDSGGGDNSAINAGAAYVYRYVGGQWQFEASLKAAYPDIQDNFGMSVAVDGDVVLIGSFKEDGGDGGVNGDQQDESASSSGAAYVFRRVAGSWQQEAYLKAGVPGGGTDDIGDFFGISVALRGDLALIGAPYEASNAPGVNGNQADDSALGAGAAYLFRYDGLAWEPDAYIKASHPGGTPVAGSAYEGDRFGWRVALGEDLIAIAAPGEDSASHRVSGDELDDSAPSAGAVYAFHRDAGGWGQRAYLKSSNGDGPTMSFESSGDELGCSVAISGQRVIAAAFAEDANQSGVHSTSSSDNSLSFSGAVYVFE